MVDERIRCTKIPVFPDTASYVMKYLRVLGAWTYHKDISVNDCHLLVVNVSGQISSFDQPHYDIPFEIVFWKDVIRWGKDIIHNQIYDTRVVRRPRDRPYHIPDIGLEKRCGQCYHYWIPRKRRICEFCAYHNKRYRKKKSSQKPSVTYHCHACGTAFSTTNMKRKYCCHECRVEMKRECTRQRERALKEYLDNLTEEERLKEIQDCWEEMSRNMVLR